MSVLVLVPIHLSVGGERGVSPGSPGQGTGVGIALGGGDRGGSPPPRRQRYREIRISPPGQGGTLSSWISPSADFHWVSPRTAPAPRGGGGGRRPGGGGGGYESRYPVRQGRGPGPLPVSPSPYCDSHHGPLHGDNWTPPALSSRLSPEPPGHGFPPAIAIRGGFPTAHCNRTSPRICCPCNRYSRH